MKHQRCYSSTSSICLWELYSLLNTQHPLSLSRLHTIHTTSAASVCSIHSDTASLSSEPAVLSELRGQRPANCLHQADKYYKCMDKNSLQIGSMRCIWEEVLFLFLFPPPHTLPQLYVPTVKTKTCLWLFDWWVMYLKEKLHKHSVDCVLDPWLD